jgi:tetratricopeptide (TPR) repeat protein
MLTEGAPVPERPTVGLGGGPYVPSADAALAPHTAAGFLARARAAEQAGNLRDAVECYGDLLSFDPYSLDAHLGRGRCLVDLGDYGAAMSDFTRAEDLAPDSPEPVVEMGNLYFARKEYKKAIAYYDHAIEQSPNHAMALCRRGICYYHRKRMSEAHADLKRAEALGAQVPGLQRYIQMTARGPAKR